MDSQIIPAVSKVNMGAIMIMILNQKRIRNRNRAQTGEIIQVITFLVNLQRKIQTNYYTYLFRRS